MIQWLILNMSMSLDSSYLVGLRVTLLGSLLMFCICFFYSWVFWVLIYFWQKKILCFYVFACLIYFGFLFWFWFVFGLNKWSLVWFIVESKISKQIQVRHVRLCLIFNLLDKGKQIFARQGLKNKIKDKIIS